MVVRNFGEPYFSGKIMNIEELKTFLRNKINDLNNKKNLAYMSGDLVSYDQITNQIDETQLALNKLES
jgi:predicted MPP superfamily phosphohydrolase